MLFLSFPNPAYVRTRTFLGYLGTYILTYKILWGYPEIREIA